MAEKVYGGGGRCINSNPCSGREQQEIGGAAGIRCITVVSEVDGGCKMNTWQ
jgi:hypothetical protein